MKQPHVVLPGLQCELGEGPVWDAARQCLWWVDILVGHVHQYVPMAQTYRTLAVGEMIGSVALRTDGGLVAATKTGFHLLDADTGALSPIGNPEAYLPTNRFNDGKVDPQGRFWAGTMSLQDQRGQGSLYMLDAQGTIHTQLTGVSISNGLAWSGDGLTLFYVDSPTFEVHAFSCDPLTGALSNGRVLITVPPEFGDPDGMTIDAEGCLWIAHWDGWQVTRWNSQTGALLQRIPLPVSRVTSCTFGGPSLEDLYVTSARTGLNEEQFADQPLAGGLFVLENVGGSGLEPARYGAWQNTAASGTLFA